ncbi:TetR/AcrR family transcriptional regulator [Aliihoeflea sp. PC F10.4]
MVKRGRRTSAWKNAAPSRDQIFQFKRTALFREAARTFSERGYRDTSLDDVAKMLGVTKSALYYYVKNKQELLFECHLLAQNLGDVALEHARTHGTDGRTKVTLFYQKYIELVTGEMGSCAVLTEFSALEPENRAIIGRRRDKFQAEFSQFFAEGKEDGSIRGIDSRMTIFLFMGAINWLSHWFRPDGQLSGEEIARQFADLFDSAIKAPASEQQGT